MNDSSRRSFLIAAAGVPAGARLASSADVDHSLKAFGVELYTVRTLLPQKPLETLQALERMGYREVELIPGNLDKIWPALQQTRLKAVAMHLDTALFAPEKSSELGEVIAAAKQHGVEYLVYPYVAPSQRGGLDVMRKLAQVLNQAGETCRAAGLQLCYHNHAFEFEPMDGSTPLKVLLEETRRELVGLEMDVFWVSVGGHDPVELLHQYAGRVPLLHLKDKASGTAMQYNEIVAKSAFKEVGSGTLEFPAILRAASSAGVKHYFVEQDFTPADPLASLRQSAEYLNGLKF